MLLRSRKELVLLAYLSVRNGAVQRVDLAALLWGDRPEARARQSLRQALLGLKREIGNGLDVSADVVQLLPGWIRLDLHEIDADLAAGRIEDALARRTGEFLESAEAADVEPLASWVRSVRMDARRRIAAAVNATALARLEAGDADAAAACAAAACMSFPLDEPFHRLYIEMLDEAGRTAEALATAEVFAERLRSELDVEPSPTFRALEAGLHKRAYAKQQRRNDQRAAAITEFVSGDSAAQPGGLTGAAELPVSARAQVHRRRPRATPVIAAAIALLGLIVLLPSLFRRPVEAAAVDSRIAIMPFQVRGDSEFNYLGEGIVDLVSAGLEGAGPMHAVDPRSLLISVRSEPGAALDPSRAAHIAQRFSAGHFVLGSVTEVGGRIQLSASLYTFDGELERSIATTAGSETEVPGAVDELIRLILAAPSDKAERRITSVAALTTKSLPALKAFLQGEAHYRRGEYEKATEAYQSSIAADSLFAFAYFRLALAASWIPAFDVSALAAEYAGLYGDKLPGNDRKLLEAFLADRRGEFVRPARLLREVLAEDPHNLDARYSYAELLFHRGPPHASDVHETIRAFHQVLALDPADGSSRVHLARLAALTSDHETLSRLFRERNIDPSAKHQREIAALHAFSDGDAAEKRRFLLGLISLPPQEIWDLAWYTSSFTKNATAGAAIAGVLTQPQFEARWRTAGHVALAHFAAARGRLAEMQRHIATVEILDPDWALETRAVPAMQPLLPIAPSEARSLAVALRARPRPPFLTERAPNIFNLSGVTTTSAQSRNFMTGMLDLRAGDTLGAHRVAEALLVDDSPGYQGFRSRAFGLEILSWIHLRAGRAASIADEIRRGTVYMGAETVAQFNSTTQYSAAARRFLRGEAALALGKPAEAVHWYAAVPDALAYEAIHIAPAELRMAQAYDRMGNNEAASRHYRRFIAMWRDCDPELRPLVDQARRRLAAL